MMCLSQFTNKNNGLCVRCVHSCVAFNCKGTHGKPSSINTYMPYVYLVYCFSRARICSELIFTTLALTSIPLLKHLRAIKKSSCARKIYLNGTHGKHFNKSFTSKAFDVFTIFENANHDSKHHKHLGGF